jgi:hypothetical protein
MWVLKASKPACVMVTIVEYTPYFWFFSAVFFSFLFFLFANLLTLDNLSSKLSFNFYEIAPQRSSHYNENSFSFGCDCAGTCNLTSQELIAI